MIKEITYRNIKISSLCRPIRCIRRPLIFMINLGRLQEFIFSILACRLLLHLRLLHPVDSPYSEQTLGFLTTLETESEPSEELNPYIGIYE